ncbi:hypothetical protein, partial [Pandoraea sputorum]|uniref:hypothetical protein n=1 Tax=Pandoraea sputorum TaxID=93222 RepID=UPI00177B5718
ASRVPALDGFSNLSVTLCPVLQGQLQCTTTDTGNEIPHRFLVAIFEELGEMTVELVCECHKLKADFLDA